MALPLPLARRDSRGGRGHQLARVWRSAPNSLVKDCEQQVLPPWDKVTASLQDPSVILAVLGKISVGTSWALVWAESDNPTEEADRKQWRRRLQILVAGVVRIAMHFERPAYVVDRRSNAVKRPKEVGLCRGCCSTRLTRYLPLISSMQHARRGTFSRDKHLGQCSCLDRVGNTMRRPRASMLWRWPRMSSNSSQSADAPSLTGWVPMRPLFESPSRYAGHTAAALWLPVSSKPERAWQGGGYGRMDDEQERNQAR